MPSVHRVYAVCAWVLSGSMLSAHVYSAGLCRLRICTQRVDAVCASALSASMLSLPDPFFVKIFPLWPGLRSSVLATAPGSTGSGRLGQGCLPVLGFLFKNYSLASINSPRETLSSSRCNLPPLRKQTERSTDSVSAGPQRPITQLTLLKRKKKSRLQRNSRDFPEASSVVPSHPADGRLFHTDPHIYGEFMGVEFGWLSLSNVAEISNWKMNRSRKREHPKKI